MKVVTTPVDITVLVLEGELENKWMRAVLEGAAHAYDNDIGVFAGELLAQAYPGEDAGEANPWVETCDFEDCYLDAAHGSAFCAAHLAEVNDRPKCSEDAEGLEPADFEKLEKADGLTCVRCGEATSSDLAECDRTGQSLCYSCEGEVRR